MLGGGGDGRSRVENVLVVGTLVVAVVAGVVGGGAGVGCVPVLAVLTSRACTDAFRMTLGSCKLGLRLVAPDTESFVHNKYNY